MDGVLIDAKKIHYDSLNYALSIHDTRYRIDIDEHLNIYDGLKTTEKYVYSHIYSKKCEILCK